MLPNTSPFEQCDRARRLAEAAHAGQRYGSKGFMDHLTAVVAVMIRFDIQDPSVISAGWLHDLLEDSGEPFKSWLMSEAECTAETLQIVQAVTDEPGSNRRERKAATYLKIRAAGAKAVVVKLADRIANVEQSHATNREKLAMYAEEHAEFREALYWPGEHKAMWLYLDLLLKERP